MSESDPVIDLTDLLGNVYLATDLTIHCDQFKWKVHHKEFTERSAYFSTRCLDSDGNFRTDRVIVWDGSPLSIARFIQFIYLDDFEYDRNGAISARDRRRNFMPDQAANRPEERTKFALNQLVTPDCLDQEQERYNGPNFEALVDLDMVKIGRVYQAPDLLNFATDNILYHLKRNIRLKRPTGELIPKAVRALAPDFPSSGGSVDDLFHILMQWKYAIFKDDAPNTRHFTAYANEHPDVLRMSEEIRELIKEGGPFAVRLAHASEVIQQETLSNPDWPYLYAEGRIGFVLQNEQL